MTQIFATILLFSLAPSLVANTPITCQLLRADLEIPSKTKERFRGRLGYFNPKNYLLEIRDRIAIDRLRPEFEPLREFREQYETDFNFRLFLRSKNMPEGELIVQDRIEFYSQLATEYNRQYAEGTKWFKVKYWAREALETVKEPFRNPAFLLFQFRDPVLNTWRHNKWRSAIDYLSNPFLPVEKVLGLNRRIAILAILAHSAFLDWVREKSNSYSRAQHSRVIGLSERSFLGADIEQLFQGARITLAEKEARSQERYQIIEKIFTLDNPGELEEYLRASKLFRFMDILKIPQTKRNKLFRFYVDFFTDVKTRSRARSFGQEEQLAFIQQKAREIERIVPADDPYIEIYRGLGAFSFGETNNQFAELVRDRQRGFSLPMWFLGVLIDRYGEKTPSGYTSSPLSVVLQVDRAYQLRKLRQTLQRGTSISKFERFRIFTKTYPTLPNDVIVSSLKQLKSLILHSRSESDATAKFNQLRQTMGRWLTGASTIPIESDAFVDHIILYLLDFAKDPTPLEATFSYHYNTNQSIVVDHYDATFLIAITHFRYKNMVASGAEPRIDLLVNRSELDAINTQLQIDSYFTTLDLQRISLHQLPGEIFAQLGAKFPNSFKSQEHFAVHLKQLQNHIRHRNEIKVPSLFVKWPILYTKDSIAFNVAVATGF